MSELTGRPGNSCSPVIAPTNQNGLERAKANKKKIKGDLRIDVLVFMILQLLAVFSLALQSVFCLLFEISDLTGRVVQP